MKSPARLFALALVAACGGTSSGDTSDAGAGADASSRADAAPSCGTTWRLVEVPATAIQLIDPALVNTERSVRFLVTAQMTGCQELAAPQMSFVLEGEGMTVHTMAWEALGAVCTEEIRSVERPVSVRLGRPGTWIVGAGTEFVSVEVGIAPSRPCMNGGGGGACGMDCDCASGERCLGANGLGGPFTQCATACEVDRDCGGTGACRSVADGLAFACVSGTAECDGSRPCAAGFQCTGGACQAEYSLDAQSRAVCACDDDCEPGLRCIEPGPQGGERRCEAACPTQTNAVCTGAHRCGPAAQDIAGIATSDSVCIWDGE